MTCYHLSKSRLHDTVLIPRIPSSISTGEDNKTKRVCLSTNINGCINAIAFSQSLGVGDRLFVYSTNIDDESVIIPNESMVTDVRITDEVWSIKPVSLKYIGYVSLTKRGKVIYWNDSIKSPSQREFKYKLVIE